jgi:hypothetical protein
MHSGVKLWYKTTQMPIVKRFLRVMLGYSRTPNSELLLKGYRVFEGMSGNPAFPKPPVDLRTFQALLERFSSAIAEALYRDQRAIVARDTLRNEVILSLRQLGHYVEGACNNEEATLISSGFDLMPSSFASPEALPVPRLIGVEHGRTGQLLVRITPLGRKAKSYDLRHAVQPSDGKPPEWIEQKVASARARIAITDLTPGVIYIFEVRAHGQLGYTDWSPSVTKMCT